MASFQQSRRQNTIHFPSENRDFQRDSDCLRIAFREVKNRLGSLFQSVEPLLGYIWPSSTSAVFHDKSFATEMTSTQKTYLLGKVIDSSWLLYKSKIQLNLSLELRLKSGSFV